MDMAAPSKPSFKQACDNCRRRKIKCSRELPCDKCQRLLLSCSYSDVLRRKGPKFRTLYPLAPIHPLSTRNNASQERLYTDQDPYQPDGSYGISSPASPTFMVTDAQYVPHDLSDTLSQLPPPELVSSPDSTDSLMESVRGQSTGQLLPGPRRLSSQILLAHVNVYLKYLFPIMPVVRGDQLRRDSQQPEMLSASRYAFLASLCAATHIQLKLDGDTPVPDPARLESLGDGHSLFSGETLLSEALRARRDCDIVDDVSIESLLTSFFLFASYGNLDKQSHAWYYLCEAISMTFSLGLHRESSYAELSVEDAEERRRVFWLLFITERGYALQQAKPVMLRSSIHKPQVLCSEDPILAYGFINLIGIFEKLTSNLYDWLSAGGADGLLERPPTSNIQASLCKPVSLDGVMEIQQVDILITQQWLQAMMWKLSMSHATQPGNHDDRVLPFHLPVMVGKAVMGVIGSASQGAVDAHGIGMEQKLFDMGLSVADVTQSLGTKGVHRLAESTIDPRELLWGILQTLSQIRGSPSYLFPTLLERCKSVLGLDCTITVGNFLPTLGAHVPNASGLSGVPWAGEQGWDLLAACRDVRGSHSIHMEGEHQEHHEHLHRHLLGAGLVGSQLGF
ncbi:Amylolytic gene expression activator [Penicillium ucsense]|uniref:Amylolytic gene expression activator n=1 Tax=Penicillium ucsense TaxID=2839758 RepID=A0A8J8WDN5_9EURO|nr:Amylolytic gene expression activator [Penicillium ucsense]KAF7732910.1 Amylolytic gene expression activator [Penicillium ucsense]